MTKKLTATKVSQLLDISVPTLNNWYKWYDDPNFKKPKEVPVLPEYEQAGSRAPRYWKVEDIPLLIAFKAWLPKGRGGVMGDCSARYWGDRGKRALENKAKKSESL